MGSKEEVKERCGNNKIMNEDENPCIFGTMM